MNASIGGRICSNSVHKNSIVDVFLKILTGGLLHSVPSHEQERDVSEKIRAALLECVEEKEAGGRVKAVNNLSDLLALFISLQ